MAWILSTVYERGDYLDLRRTGARLNRAAFAQQRSGIFVTFLSGHRKRSLPVVSLQADVGAVGQ